MTLIDPGRRSIREAREIVSDCIAILDDAPLSVDSVEASIVFKKLSTVLLILSNLERTEIKE